MASHLTRRNAIIMVWNCTQSKSAAHAVQVDFSAAIQMLEERNQLLLNLA